MASCLVPRGYQYRSLSDVVREQASARGYDHGRESLIRVGNELRRAGGPGALVALIAPTLRLPAVVDSVRNPGEVEALRALGSFLLIAVEAPAELRLRRMRARGRLGDVTSVDQFLRLEEKENSSLPSEQRIGATVALADAVVVNDSTLENLAARVLEALNGRGGKPKA